MTGMTHSAYIPLDQGIANSDSPAYRVDWTSATGTFIMGYVEQTPCGAWVAFTLERRLLLDDHGCMRMYHDRDDAGLALSQRTPDTPLSPPL